MTIPYYVFRGNFARKKKPEPEPELPVFACKKPETGTGRKKPTGRPLNVCDFFVVILNFVSWFPSLQDIIFMY